MAKFNLNQPIPNLEGEPLKQGDKVLTHGAVIRNALMQPVEGDTGSQKLRKFEVGLKCATDESELSAEDITLIKKCVGDMYAPLVVGRVFNLLDPKG